MPNRRRTLQGGRASPAAPPFPPEAPAPSGASGGSHFLQIQLPPELASERELQNLAHIAQATNSRRRQAGSRLAEIIAANEQRLSAQRRRRDQALLRRAVRKDEQLAKRQEQAETDYRKELEALSRAQRGRLARGVQRGLWHDAVVLSALPLLAVYGRRNLTHNLTLLTLVLVWLLGEELTDMLSGSTQDTGSERVGRAWWLYTAPAANLLAGWWLLHARQHERTVTGVESGFKLRGSRVVRGFLGPAGVAPPALQGRARIEEYAAEVDLVPCVAPEFALDVVTLDKPAAVASVLSITWSERLPAGERPTIVALTARVELGKLHLTLTVRRAALALPRRALAAAQVAWMVAVQ